VLERRAVVGGATVGEELFPGYTVSTCADGAPRLLPEVARDLRLSDHGLRLRRTDPLVVAPLRPLARPGALERRPGETHPLLCRCRRAGVRY
jgi:phytoene dehydrogenase-like protein